MDYVLILLLFYLSYVSGFLALVESIGVNTTIQMEEKTLDTTIMGPRCKKITIILLQHTTSWRLNTFQFSGRDQIRNGNGDHVSHYAMWHTDFGEFYGIQADISIWGSPNQGPSQQSGAALQINCLESGRYKTFVAGFQVAHALYNNNDVRFFTYWTTTDGATSTGCYDLRCPGYVPASGASLLPGQAVAPPSTYGAEGRQITLSLNKDPSSGDWVLYRHYQSYTPSFLGHFPGSLCSSTPRTLAWLGFVSYPVNTQGPPMGSGHFPKDDKTKSGFFTNINLHDSQGHDVEPVWIPLVDMPVCYNETDVFNREGEGFMFYYGGPSGCIG